MKRLHAGNPISAFTGPKKVLHRLLVQQALVGLALALLTGTARSACPPVTAEQFVRYIEGTLGFGVMVP